MRRAVAAAMLSPRWPLALALAACAACGIANSDAAADTEKTSSALYAEDDVLWPMDADGLHATVPVCWAPIDLGGETFPADAPDIEPYLSQRKLWVQQAVEQQWNARTPVQFTDWSDCPPPDAYYIGVRLVPISSQVTSCLSYPGRSCTEALGTIASNAYLNITFGYELDVALAALEPLYALSNPTGDDFTKESALYTQAAGIAFPATIYNDGLNAMFDPTEDLATFRAEEQRGIGWLALHEFGHLAGFAHEQNRADDIDAALACVAASGDTAQDALEPWDIAHGNHPLGAFDAQSIMSYCRTDTSATLTDEDAAQATAVYLASVSPMYVAPLEEPQPPFASGSGCNAGGGDASGGLAIALAVVALRRRRARGIGRPWTPSKSSSPTAASS